MTPEQLIALGCVPWGPPGYTVCRYYVEDLARRMGLTFETSLRGTIRRAMLDGDPISPARAAEIWACLRESRLWFDLEAGRWAWMIPGCRGLTGRQIAQRIIAEIEDEARDLV